MQGMNTNDTSVQVWRCPNCGGLGTMADGLVELGSEGFRVIRPASKCWLCAGKGKVHVSPIPEDRPA